MIDVPAALLVATSPHPVAGTPLIEDISQGLEFRRYETPSRSCGSVPPDEECCLAAPYVASIPTLSVAAVERADTKSSGW